MWTLLFTGLTLRLRGAGHLVASILLQPVVMARGSFHFEELSLSGAGLSFVVKESIRVIKNKANNPAPTFRPVGMSMALNVSSAITMRPNINKS